MNQDKHPQASSPIAIGEQWQVLGYPLSRFDELQLSEQLYIHHRGSLQLKGRELFMLQHRRGELFLLGILEQIEAGYGGDRSSSDYLAFKLYLTAFHLFAGSREPATGRRLLPRFSQEFLLAEFKGQQLDLDAAERELLLAMLYEGEVYGESTIDLMTLMGMEPFRDFLASAYVDLAEALINAPDAERRAELKADLQQVQSRKEHLLELRLAKDLTAFAFSPELDSFLFDVSQSGVSLTNVQELYLQFIDQLGRTGYILPRLYICRSPQGEIVDLRLDEKATLLAVGLVHSDAYGLLPKESPILSDARIIRRQLRRAQDGVVSASMRSKGLNYGINFGITQQHIRRLATLVEPNLYLARYLWQRNVRELKLIACLLYPAERLSLAEALDWVDAAGNTELEEQLVFNLLQHMPQATALANDCIGAASLHRQGIGYMLWARLFLQPAAVDAELAERFFALASERILDAELAFRLRHQIALALKRYLHMGAQAQANVQALLQRLKALSDAESAELYADISFEIEYLD